ncbi:MAG: replicative DNA helicase [Pseudomonadota bacterium]
MADGATPAGVGAEAESRAPHNIEAEQALLGALLVNNDVFDKVASVVTPEHFYDPVHARIFEIASARIQNNTLASPVTLKAFMEGDPGLEALGGPTYLLRLADAAISIFAARDYAQMVYDLAMRRSLIEIGDEIQHKAQSVTVESDPREQITDAEARLYQLAEQGRVDGGFQSFLSAITSAVHVANAAYQRDGGLAGISTGFTDLNDKLGGLHKSDLLILAGRPSMGKSGLACNVAFNIAKDYRKGTLSDGSTGAVDGGVVGFFSLEMSAEQLATRLLSAEARVPSHKIREGNLSEMEFRSFVEAAKALERVPLYIDDTPALSIAAVAARARRLKRQFGLDLLVIDYLQLMTGTSKSGDNRVQEVSEITQGLKAIAKELDIPVIALSQLSRQVENREDKRPQLSDLRESGSIEQDADAVMFIYREEYYAEREKPSEDNLEAMEKWQMRMDRCAGKAEVIIGKQRHGPIGTVEMAFEGPFVRFSDLAKPWQGGAQDI